MALGIGMMAFGQGFALTQYVQSGLGHTALFLGVSSAVGPLMAMTGSYFAQFLVTRVGCRLTGTAGCALAAGACIALAEAAGHGDYLVRVLLPQGVFGFGVGLAGVSSSIVTVSRVISSDTGVASALQNASFQLGTGLGVAIVASVMAGGLAGQAAWIDASQEAFLLAGGFAAFAFLCSAVAGSARTEQAGAVA